jgi:superfamily I DNA/RNA helicase
VFPAHRVLMRDDLSDQVPVDLFLEKLLAMFTVRYPCTLTLPQRDRIRWHLFPEIRMNTQTSLDLEPDDGGMKMPDLMQVMDLQQEQIARTLGDGHRVIHGVAGSGKTMILIFRAEQLAAAARPDNPVLVLCFNRELAGRITAALRSRGVDERVQVRTFHSWCDDLVRTYHLEVPAGLKGSEHFAELAKTVEHAVIQTKQVPGGQYLALLVDEAHDFDEPWLRIASRMVNPATNSLLVLYDDAQSIYQKRHRKFNFSRVDINAVGRTHILKLNYRNTAEILTLAMHCAQGLLEARTETDEEPPLIAPTTAGRRGPIPVFLQARSGLEEAQLVTERIAEAIATGTPAEDIAVLCRAKYLMQPIHLALLKRGVAVQSMGDDHHRRFDWLRPAVKLVTMHSAKGLEFPNVFVSGLQAMPMREDTIEDATQLLYVAMTRATHHLTLSASGDSEIVQRIKASIEQVRAAMH